VLCQACEKNNAEFHAPKIINNELVYVHLCMECAKHSKPFEISNGLDDKLQYVLDGLLESGKKNKSGFQRPVCDECGTMIKYLMKKKKLGCAHCYEVFSDYLEKDLQVHKIKFDRHSLSDKYYEQIKRMKKELKKAVDVEDFEKAASLRDRIHTYEREGFSSEH